MQLRNTKESYGLIAVFFHWAVALGFLGSYISVYYRHWFSQGEFDVVEMNSNTIALYLHLSFGITIAIFVVLRIIWTMMSTKPDDAPGGKKLEHAAAHAMHRILYAVMIIMPITGYMGTKLNTNFFFLIEITKFADTQLYSLVVERWLNMSWESFEAIVDAIHKTGGAFIVWVLIVIHAGAAIYHHIVRKDMVLKRMATWLN